MAEWVETPRYRVGVPAGILKRRATPSKWLLRSWSLQDLGVNLGHIRAEGL